MCGEKPKSTKLSPTGLGSPPRVRGKDAQHLKKLFKRGITPACAGKSCRIYSFISVSWDHPRVCGEKLPICGNCAAVKGSPPRVRGKVLNENEATSYPGITPACAGKSFALFYILLAVWDHPRVCGEKTRTASASCTSAGSPPRVRGKAHCHSAPRPSARITPACAGKSQ